MSKLRHAGWALGLMGAAVACNGILALDELPRGTAASVSGGPLFDYAEDPCGVCVQTGCGFEEEACAGDLDCAILYACLALCGLDDVACRHDCEKASPTAVEQPLAVDLDGCRRAKCLGHCFGSGGLAWGLFEGACADCIERDCKTVAQACIADARCERAYACMSDQPCDDPSCIMDCFYTTEANNVAGSTDFQECWGDCRADCPSVGKDWACVDAYSWSRGDGPFTFELDVDVLVDVQGNTESAQGVDVELCNSISCQPEGTVDANGKALLHLTPYDGFWRGHVRFDGSATVSAGTEPIIPTHFYFGRPLTRFENRLGTNLLPQWAQPFLEVVLEESLAPELGHLTMLVLDCSWQWAPDVTFEIDPEGIVPNQTVAFFVVSTDNGPAFKPSVDGMTTDRLGGGGFINVLPGDRTVVARVDGLEVARLQLTVVADEITSTYVLPNETP